VLANTKDGGARIQVKRDWIKIQTLAGQNFTFEYDSRTPDPRALENRQVALSIEPLIAMLPAAYEFRLDAKGNVLSVDGVDAARKLYQAALIRLNEPGAERYGPTEKEEIERFRAWLFPSLGGGEIVNGEPRKYIFKVNTGYNYWATFTGESDATHNDEDTFCVELDHCVAGEEGFDNAGVLPNGQKIAGLQVTAEQDRLKGAWVFDRTAGRLLSTRMHPKFRLVVAFPTTDQNGKSGFNKDSGDDPQETGGTGNAGGGDTGNGKPTPPDDSDAPK
jgi:hypothetical protein